MLKTFESEVAEAKFKLLEALKEQAAKPEICVAAMADLVGAVAADLTVGGHDGTITLDQRLDLFIDRARKAYRRRLTTVTIGQKFSGLNRS